MRKLIVAARGSLLSRAQAEYVRGLLARNGIETVFEVVKTKGDNDRESALRKIGGNGLFVREIENALLAGTADIAVHCGKDLPFRTADGLVIAGTPEAASPLDCLLFAEGKRMEDLRVIGTGSVRREMALRSCLPNAKCRQIRGNINTRIHKLLSGEYDGIVLAEAGLTRLAPDLTGLKVHTFSPDEMIPAACQGILALQCREDDAEAAEILRGITDPAVWERFETERDLFCRMQADCTTAMGVYAAFEGRRVTLRAVFDRKQAVESGGREDLPRLKEKVIEILTAS